ncbi:cytochrome c-type biogenesis protein CcmH [Salinimonas marina]|uniref:Cytochrome c-type biogenesis protein n=1 Tax=Salinimonas marina TaxID=2785918 RepID=A0A7S9DWJ5_9ALTE|nr:cytochrome c-type biogenesis protein [Salinimonas marina]QPG05043.1 cytochrome c-type biogenesis protein CcmH [Salinimonas marina]
MRVFIFIVLVCGSAWGWAAQNNYQFDNETQRAQFTTLTQTLRCPMCQNQNIADSDAMIAKDMRRKVYQLTLEGQSREQIIAYMKARYGDFVYYEPPLTVATIWLWILPVGFALCGLWIVLKRGKPAPPADMAEQLAKAERLLKQDKE